MGYGDFGWIVVLVLGGFSGWLASLVMKSHTGIVMDVILGIVGAGVASALLGFVNVEFSGLVGFLIAGFLGACLLIWAGRLVWRPP